MTHLFELLDNALCARKALFDERHETAFRLFNGFLEGFPNLSIELYARTLLLLNYAPNPAEVQTAEVQNWLIEKLPWVRCLVIKIRNGQSDVEKRGLITYGKVPDHKIWENGVWYSVNLALNRDTSFYLDTRNLRKWAGEHLAGKTVLNTFAYTGSLGVAAKAGGATRVIQLDRNRNFLNVAKTSYTLNGFPIDRQDFLAADFFPAASRFKRANQNFDCIFLDPPFFSTTPKGQVDLETAAPRLINKIRPLVKDGGWLVAINNALFVSGKNYLATLEALCADGYVQIEELLPVPADCAGFPATRHGDPPVDPAPFNHSTKIAILRVHRKTAMSIPNPQPAKDNFGKNPDHE